MIAETKNQLSQLVEINRALSHDLDQSNRKGALLAREREDLLVENERLRAEIRRAALERAGDRARTDERSFEHRSYVRELEEMRRELDSLLQDAEAARARAHQAEERQRALLAQVHKVERERDALNAQLEESLGFVDEIKSRLLELPEPRAERRSLLD